MANTTVALRFWKQPNWVAFAVLFSSLVAALALGNFARDNRREVVAPRSSERTENGRTFIESESVTVTRRGFEPVAITRTQGKFILVVDNRSGIDLSLRFSRETGESVHEIRSSRDQLDWNEVVDLRPGRYVLTEVNHPSWACNIVITAN